MARRMNANQAEPMIGARVPPELKAKLVAAAKEGDRSLSHEIVRRLRQSFEREQPHADAPNVTTISKYAQRKE